QSSPLIPSALLLPSFILDTKPEPKRQRNIKERSESGWWMAKTNKFTSINFNHIYEKNLSTNSKSNANSKGPSPSSSSSSYSAISSPHNKTHGRMLVLTRPTPKPISNPPPLSPQPQPQQQPQQPHLQSPSQQTRQPPDQIRADPRSDAISLRPLGRTGSSPPILSPGSEAQGSSAA
ncbi:hypothetical protein GBA52_010395, partial [Prunus armeniaca]